MKRFLQICVLLSVVSSAQASGMLLPKDESLPPLAIKHQRVNVDIKDGVATVRIEQVFKNSVNRDLEAVFIFPLPENASIADFAMYINGKRMSGELVEKGKARKIYENIVRRLKDPGLLEYMGGNLFRISIFPVPKNGEQRIELEYSQTLEYESGLYKMIYPLKTGQKASSTLEDFTISARIHSRIPLKSIYSPSHEVGVSRKGDHEAVIGFEEERYALDRDFVLYYGVSRKSFGLNLLTHADEGEDGYYMMLLSPRVVADEGSVLPKDVTLVLDTSGSMAGEKIEQAREALQYCVKRLNPADRFNIVCFSTDVESFSDDLVEVSDKSRKQALEFVEKIEARGGTAIDGALKRALQLDYNEKRPGIVLFLTDGKPTIGESDTDIIIDNIARKNTGAVRFFVFGVGEKVNTHLLDRISGEHGGLSRYVKPDEDIEVKVSSLIDKLSHPVLSKLSLEVDKIKTRKVHPRALPDLFSGDQLIVFGRYENKGHVAIRLFGEAMGKKREFVYEGDFPAVNSDNTFIPRLWATRRVGHLLDEIRLNGEEAELKEEVILLSKEFGIMTPYTSYLVLENEKAYQQHGIDRLGAGKQLSATRAFAELPDTGWRGGRRDGAAAEAEGDEALSGAFGSGAATAMLPVFSEEARDSIRKRLHKSGAARRPRMAQSAPDDVSDYFRNETGSEAIKLSEAIHEYKERSIVGGKDIANVRQVGDKVFVLVSEQWIDKSYREGMKTQELRFASREYFKLIKEHPELKEYFAIGTKVIVVVGEMAYVVQ